MKFLLPLKLSIPLVLGVLGLLLVLLAFFDGLQRTEQQIDTEARAHLLTFGTRVASSLETALGDKSSQGISRIMMRSASEPHLLSAAVVDAQGYTLASTDVSRIGKPLANYAASWATNALPQSIATGRAMQSIDATGKELVAIFPFAMPAKRGELRSRRYAVLYLQGDLSEPKRLNWAWHVQRAWLMGAVVAVAMALVWIYFYWVVTKRLERLSAAMQRVTVGDLADCPVGVSGRDELGRLGEGFAQMLHEIRQRRQALAASEERYRSVVQSMSEGVVVLDEQGQIVATNESLAKIIGVQIDEITARTVFDSRWTVLNESGTLLAPELFPPIISIRTGQSQTNVVLATQRPDGETRWISVNSEPVQLDAARGLRGAVAVVADITLRRAAQQQSQRDRERLAAIVGSAMDGVICTDRAMRITLFNRSAERIFGYREADMLGKSLNCLMPERFRDGHDGLMQAFSEKAASKRSMGMPGEIIGVRANGEEFPIEASISRVSLDREMVLTVILRDISERKRAEAQREQLEAQLRQSQKIESLGTLTGGIAHDFNNILTAISGNVRLAQLELQEANVPIPHPVRRSLTEIEKAAARATDLVRQVLAFGRRQESQRVAVDLAAVVADALHFLRAMIPAMIDIRSRLPENLPKVAVDATQVHQIITNLGSNAAHSIGDKPGVLDVQIDDIVVSAEQAKVSVDLHAGRYLRLSFADSGQGIAADIIERIFEPFFTTKAVGQGTGLGLSVVHGIMTNHEGAIVVNSRPGAGTRFDLFFPVSEQLPTPSTAPAITDNFNSASNTTIVYIDDEEALVFLVTRILERHGYAVRGFTDPALALAELAKQDVHVDALISDLAMPGMTGFDVVRRARELRPNLPTILVSGYVRPQDVELAQQLAVQRLVLKPDTVDGLAAALHEVLLAQSSESI